MKKPSVFCKIDLKLSSVKSYKFVKDYFSDTKKLVNAIKEYKRISNIPKNEYSLLDLLKKACILTQALNLFNPEILPFQYLIMDK